MDRAVGAGAAVRPVVLARAEVADDAMADLLPRDVEALEQGRRGRVLGRIWSERGEIKIRNQGTGSQKIVFILKCMFLQSIL